MYIKHISGFLHIIVPVYKASIPIQKSVVLRLTVVEVHITIMLTEKVITIFILSVVFTKAEEISNKTFSEEITSGSGTVVDQVFKPCCVNVNHPFYSLAGAICSLTNNSVIKIIKSNVVLDTKVSLENLENISIIGLETTTVNCNWIGAISLSSCSNVIIKGIEWEKCGSSNESYYPAIRFYKSSNLTIHHCSFVSSAGQAILFLEASGNVCINNSVFTHNTQHRGHGAALEYIPAATAQARLIIDKCNFSHNGAAKSILYITGSENSLCSHLQSSIFTGNKGVPLYLVKQKLNINGDVAYKHNMVDSGGGIYSNGSVIVFNNKSNIMFYNNSAFTDGGAMFINDSKIYFSHKFYKKIMQNCLGVRCSPRKSQLYYLVELLW